MSERAAIHRPGRCCLRHLKSAGLEEERTTAASFRVCESAIAALRAASRAVVAHEVLTRCTQRCERLASVTGDAATRGLDAHAAPISRPRAASSAHKRRWVVVLRKDVGRVRVGLLRVVDRSTD